jgi:uncharacterized membrane protein YhhN
MSNPVPASTTPAPARTGVLATAIFAVFLALSAARLAAIPLDLGPTARWSMFVLMPVLAAWVLVQRGPVLVAIALLFSCGGDVLLGSGDDWFIFGMASFAVAHIFYVTHFVRAGALAAVKRRWYVLAGYVIVWAALVVWLWPDLGDLQIPVAVYSLLLGSTAVLSAGLGWVTGIGGALFFISDSFIAILDIAESATLPMPGMWIMVTYIAAQALLAVGTVRVARRSDQSPAT